MDMPGLRTEVDPLSSQISIEDCRKQEGPEIIESPRSYCCVLQFERPYRHSALSAAGHLQMSEAIDHSQVPTSPLETFV